MSSAEYVFFFGYCDEAPRNESFSISVHNTNLQEMSKYENSAETKGKLPNLDVELPN